MSSQAQSSGAQSTNHLVEDSKNQTTIHLSMDIAFCHKTEHGRQCMMINDTSLTRAIIVTQEALEEICYDVHLNAKKR
jgi:hypothetical protein